MFRKRQPPPGSRPGTLVIPAQAERPVIRVIKYRPDQLEEHDVSAVSELKDLLEDNATCWIDVHGFGDENVLRQLADLFAIHPLALEAITNVPQRPGVERYEDHTLCSTRMARLLDETIDFEQVSLFLGPNYVLTVQERSGDVFDPVRSRIRRGGPIIRSSGPGYLTYALLDAVIDGYYPILEALGEKLENLEDAIVEDPQPAILHQAYQIKSDLLAIRRSVWPQREAINALIRDEGPLINDPVRPYLRDCYDHCVQIMDVIDSYRELAGGLMDVYLASVGNRQNEVMKVLTIMASIFVPLTFMAGVYGMNFEHMPELAFEWAYPVFLVVMAVVAIGMIVYFRRKGWLGSHPLERSASLRMSRRAEEGSRLGRGQ